MESRLKNYIESLESDVASLVYSDGEGSSFEDKFTEYCTEILDDIGKSEGARVLSYIHPDSQGRVDWKINGYCLKDESKDDNNNKYYETLDLFITYFNSSSYIFNIQKDDFTKTINQIKKFLNAALKGYIDYIDPAQTELNELLKLIFKQKSSFERINIYVLINGSSNHNIEKIRIKGYEDLDVFVHVWDIPRFYKLSESTSNREPIKIEFKNLLTDNMPGIQCLKVPNSNELYECYLAILPGTVLSQLYGENSNELLESNVRAFLGQTGKYNKGIMKTIRERPEMFLPYNNGITATAENIETEVVENQLYLTKMNDFQIVNGGQTTASLFHTQKKFKDADLNKVFVQMKLTVIKDVELKNIEVPNIAKFANSQNKVTELDLSSNNPFFVQIESLSRKKYVVNPENSNLSTLWYFERINGQYRESLNKLATQAQVRQFKLQNPPQQKFVKSDVAKFLNCWELEPHYVSLGAQKNFVHYTKKINELNKKNQLPGENFYKKLIANAIVFKTTDSLFGRKNIDAIGDTNLKSFMVAYAVSYFHFLTDNRLDLWKIYEEQKIESNLKEVLLKLIVFVHEYLVKSAKGSLMSQYAKAESTWNYLKKEKYDLDIVSINNYMISKEEAERRERERDLNENNIEDTIFLISEIKKIGLKFWDGFQKYIDKNQSVNIDYMYVFDLVKKIKENKNFTLIDITTGRKGLEFIKENPDLIEEIKGLSKLEDIETLELKAIYDRLKLFSKDERNNIIALGEQTKIFTPLELANLKSLFDSFNKNEKTKEQSILRGYDSIKKLKKFGIHI